MTTFNTVNNTVVDASLSASNSLYAPDLETIAPNITKLVDSVRTAGESWVDALQRSIPFLVLTDSQKTQLASVIDRASNNLPPLNIQTPTEKMRLIVLYGTVAVFAWKLFNLGR
jgi:hypothetical protein